MLPALIVLTATAADPEALIERGIELRLARKNNDALELFLRAHELSPTPRTRAQIALAEQAIGSWIEAEKGLDEVLDGARDAWIEKNRAPLETARSIVRQHLGWLEVEANVDGAELWINGARTGTVPLSRPLRAQSGDVVVEIRRDGYERARRTIVIEPQRTAREIFFLVPIAVDAPPPRRAINLESAPAEIEPSPPYTSLALGGGGVLIAGAIAAHVIREVEVGIYNGDSCFFGGQTRDQRCAGHKSAAALAQSLAIAGYAIGGAAIAAGVYFLVAGSSEGPSIACAPSTAIVCEARF